MSRPEAIVTIDPQQIVVYFGEISGGAKDGMPVLSFRIHRCEQEDFVWVINAEVADSVKHVINMFNDESAAPHAQPGRRFATGSNRADHLLGAFSFFITFFVFISIASTIAWLVPSFTHITAIVSAIIAFMLLVFRGLRPALEMTKESLRAIRAAWFPSPAGPAGGSREEPAGPAGPAAGSE